MIDSHCHLNIDPLYSSWPVHLKLATDAGVTKILTLGTDSDSNKKALKLASQSPFIFAAIGLHPGLVADLLKSHSSDIDTEIDRYQKILRDCIKQNLNHLVALGECGLDYHRPDSDNGLNKRLQQQLLSFQLETANEFSLPVSVHIRDAQADALKLLSLHRSHGVLHCFSGDQQHLQQALSLGLYISFAGNVTYKNAKDLQQLAKKTPLDKLLIETDSPYLNPYRGQFPNTPANIKKTYQVIAKLKKIPLTQLVKQVTTNFTTLFRL